MSITDLATPRFEPDPRLVRGLVLVNGAVPLVLLGYDAWQRELGANGVSFALHTTGLLALLFFVLSLTVTPAKRITGWKHLVAGRRALGLYGFTYLVIHFGIFVVFDRAGSIDSAIHEILTGRYLQIGTVALVLFTPIAATSTDRMISRLGPRRWKRLHRLSYLATSLGALHYILLVKSDLRQPIAFAGFLGALLLFRVGTSIIDRRRRAKKRPWSGELKILRTVDESPDVRTFRLAMPAGGPLPFKHRAGQYLNIALTVNGQRLRRSYTIASAPTHADYCEITVKNVAAGGASRHLHEVLREGATLDVTAPAGRFVFEGEDASRVLLIAGGVGITPVMSMVRTLTDRRWPGRIDLLFSAKTTADIVFATELADLVKRFPNLKVCVTLTREPKESGWTGERGQLTRALIQRIVPNLRGIPIFICGPDPMMASMKAELTALGAEADQIHVEAFISPSGAATTEGTEVTELPVGAGGAVVHFAGSGTSTSVEPDETILEAAENAGIDIPFDCRSGICGQCKTKLLGGRVVMPIQDALTADDRKKGLVLACQARPVQDVIIDA